MRFDAEQEVLESVFVEMAPILHGFCGVLVELVGAGEEYVLLSSLNVTTEARQAATSRG